MTLLLLAMQAGAGADSRAAELAKLRREVETLSAQLSEEKEEARGKLRAIEAQKMEIEVQIRREDLRLQQVEGELSARREELSTHTTRGSTLSPAVHDAVARIRGVVSAGLPYRLSERLAELDTLDAQLRSGVLTPEAATARLWSFAEDELRLAREVGLDRQVVTVDGSEVLADVARLGMAGLFFQTEGGKTGMVTRNGGGWDWTIIAGRDDRRDVTTLFDKLRHGVRTGAFTLPNPGGAP